MVLLAEYGFFGSLGVFGGSAIFAIFSVLAFRGAHESYKDRDYLTAFLSTAFGILWSIPLIIALYYGWFLVLVGIIGAIIYIAIKR